MARVVVQTASRPETPDAEQHALQMKALRNDVLLMFRRVGPEVYALSSDERTRFQRQLDPRSSAERLVLVVPRTSWGLLCGAFRYAQTRAERWSSTAVTAAP